MDNPPKQNQNKKIKDHKPQDNTIINDQTIPYHSTIHVHFVNDEEIQKLNKQQRQKDYPTDVLSFSINETLPDGQYYIGDVIVNIDQAKRQMKEYSNNDLRRELAELVEHGTLHLLGIHHEGDDEDH